MIVIGDFPAKLSDLVTDRHFTGKENAPQGNLRGVEVGAGDEIRTRDSHVGNVVLYQLSYSCVDSGFKGGGLDRQGQSSAYPVSVFPRQMQFPSRRNS
jgi:hypothetical protein